MLQAVLSLAAPRQGSYYLMTDLPASMICCRLILFLQQSSVEWASSLWLHVVQELDPNFQRTVCAGLHACHPDVSHCTYAC